MSKQTATTPAAKTTKSAAKKPAAKPAVEPKPAPTPKLSNEQKRKLAWILLEHAAVLAETWDDVRSDYECDDVDASLVAPILSQWLQYLPHDAWPANFPEPTSKYVRGDA